MVEWSTPASCSRGEPAVAAVAILWLGYGRDFRGTVVRFSELALGLTEPPVHWIATTFSTGLKRPEHEAFNTEYKNECSYASFPVFLHGMHRPFTFVFCEVPSSILDWRGRLFPARFSTIFRSPTSVRLR